jgi:hypothetical protein
MKKRLNASAMRGNTSENKQHISEKRQHIFFIFLYFFK